MSINYKKILVGLFFSCCTVWAIHVPHPGRLKKVYNISDVEGIQFATQFLEYEDNAAYGFRPNCLDMAHLKTLNSKINWSDPQSFSIKSKKDLYVAKMKGAFVSPSHLGTVFDSQQQLLFDIVVSPGKPIFSPVNQRVQRFQVLRHKKLATVQGPTLFYHWVIDRMPSILLLREFLLRDPEIKLVINAGMGAPGYVHAYLDLLGIPKNQRIVAAGNTLLHAKELYFATPFLMEPIPRGLLLALRSELIKAAKQHPSSRQYNDNLIVVIQRRERDRRIKNLNELLNILKSTFSDEDYEIVVFDASMSISEQIQIFNNARLVIGVMASGLTNILYTKPGTSIIEIHPESGASLGGAEWCWWLASAVGADYWVAPARFKFSDASVVCPIDAVNKILKKIVMKKNFTYLRTNNALPKKL